MHCIEVDQFKSPPDSWPRVRLPLVIGPGVGPWPSQLPRTLFADRFLIADVLFGAEDVLGWPADRNHDRTNAGSLQNRCTDWRRRYGCGVSRAGGGVEPRCGAEAAGRRGARK